MSYDFNTGGSSQVKATELVTSMFDHIESSFYDVEYPEILWRTILPEASINTDIDPGAENYVYRSRDQKGMGQFTQGNSANIPRVGQVLGQVIVPVLDAAIGATLMDSEARRVKFGLNTSLSQDYGEIMKKGVDYHVERTFFFGNKAGKFESFLNYTGVTLITVPNVWSASDPAQMVADVNSWLTSVWINSKLVHLPDTVFLPAEQFSLLLAAHVIGAGPAGVAVSALEYLRKNNIYTAQSGKDLNIRVLRYLQGAGDAGADRAVVMEMNPRNYVLPFPMPFQLAQPVPIALGVDIFAEYVFGSFHVRFPMSMAYADGL